MAGFVLSQQRAVICSDVPAVAEGLDTAAPPPDPHLLRIEATYQIRRPALVRFLVRLGLDSVEADDVTQEAFLRAVDSSNKRGEAPHNLFQWLLAAARNIALNRIGHRKYETLAPAELWKKWESKLLDTKDTPDVDLLRKERHRHFIEAVATLSAVEQQCILLRFQEISFQAIADALKIPVHSAVYHAGTGIQKLERKLKRKAL